MAQRTTCTACSKQSGPGPLSEQHMFSSIAERITFDKPSEWEACSEKYLEKGLEGTTQRENGA